MAKNKHIATESDTTTELEGAAPEVENTPSTLSTMPSPNNMMTAESCGACPLCYLCKFPTVAKGNVFECPQCDAVCSPGDSTPIELTDGTLSTVATKDLTGELQKLFATLKSGDTVTVQCPLRSGRNLDQLPPQLLHATPQGIHYAMKAAGFQQLTPNIYQKG